MNGAATHRRNGHAPSEATIAACRSLVGTSLKGDADAARELANVPLGAWPDTLYRETARIIVDLTRDGNPLELPVLLGRLTALEISPADVSAIADAPPTCQPWTLAALIADEYREAQARRFHEMRARGDITADELRQCLGDLDADTTVDRAENRTPVDTARWFSESPKPIDCLFENMIPRGELVLYVAPGGRGKSLQAAVLIASAATGRTLYPSFVPAGQSRVFWWSSEDNEPELHRRIRRIADAFEFSPEDCQRFSENTRVYASHGKPLVDPEGKPTAEFRWLVEQVRTFKPHFVVLDPMLHFNGVDENDNPMMAVFMDRLISLIEASGVDATVMVLHHTSKANEDSGTSAAARGASSIRDHARMIFTLSQLSPTECSVFGVVNPKLFGKLDVPKVNHLPAFEKPIYFENRGGVWVEIDLTQRREETERAGRQNLVQAVVDAIADNPEGLTVYQIWHEPKGKTIRDAVQNVIGKASRNDIRLAIQDALDVGRLNGEPAEFDGRNGGTKAIIPRSIAQSPDNRPNTLANEVNP